MIKRCGLCGSTDLDFITFRGAKCGCGAFTADPAAPRVSPTPDHREEARERAAEAAEFQGQLNDLRADRGDGLHRADGGL